MKTPEEHICATMKFLGCFAHVVINPLYDTHSLGIPGMTGCRPFVPSLARAEAHAFVLTEDHCKRFVDIFDIDRNGVPGQMSLPHVSGKGTM